MKKNSIIAQSYETLLLLLKYLSVNITTDPALNLKKVESKVLMHIKIAEGKQMSFYSDKIDLENGSFTYLADKLEKRGLIKRVDAENDRRKKGLILTEEGHKTTDLINKQFREEISQRLNSLNAGEKENLLSAVKIIEKIKAKLKDSAK